MRRRDFKFYDSSIVSTKTMIIVRLTFSNLWFISFATVGQIAR